MNKFKVGDLVRGTNRGSYAITNEDMTLGEVVKVYKEGDHRGDDKEGYHRGYDICVKILEHHRRDLVGENFTVDSRYFEPAHVPKIILSPDNAEDIDWLTYKASRIIERLSEKSGMSTERLISLIVIGAEKLVEIEDGKGKDNTK